MAEVARGLQLRGVAPESFAPGSWWAYEVELALDRVLDLTDPSVLGTLGVTVQELTSQETRTAQEIAREARRAGYQALLVASVARPRAKNLVVFPEAIDSPPRVVSSHSVEISSS